MLQKKYRGLRASEISQLFQGRPRSVSSPFFRILWDHTAVTEAKFVVITSGKLHKSAVVRNRLRRSAYDMIRTHFSKWTDGMRVAIVIKHPALTLPRNEFRKELFELMKKTGLL